VRNEGLVGQTLRDFRIVSLIGRGAVGNVYRAEQITLGRHVALKVLEAREVPDKSFRERFVRESRRAAAIDHPNVIPIYEAGDIDGLLYIAMRLVEGGDLREQLRRAGALSPRRAIGVTTQVAAALEAAHGKGILHRDVKPANLLLDGDHVYLSDFGIAREVNAVRGETGSGLFLGTADYSSPEQIQGEPLDERADIYSLGCVLYECLVGTPPFDAPTQFAVLDAHIRAVPPRPSEQGVGVPTALDDVIATALAKDRSHRYRAARHLADAAARALESPERRRADVPGSTADPRPTAAAPIRATAQVITSTRPQSETRIDGVTSLALPSDDGQITILQARSRDSVGAAAVAPLALTRSPRRWVIGTLAAGAMLILLGQLLLTTPDRSSLGGFLFASGVVLALLGPIFARYFGSLPPTRGHVSGRSAFVVGVLLVFVSLAVLLSSNDPTGSISGVVFGVLGLLVGLAAILAGVVLSFLHAVTSPFKRHRAD
jgi:serine/threonine protein kinase